METIKMLFTPLNHVTEASRGSFINVYKWPSILSLSLSISCLFQSTKNNDKLETKKLNCFNLIWMFSPFTVRLKLRQKVWAKGWKFKNKNEKKNQSQGLKLLGISWNCRELQGLAGTCWEFCVTSWNISI